MSLEEFQELEYERCKSKFDFTDFSDFPSDYINPALKICRVDNSKSYKHEIFSEWNL